MKTEQADLWIALGADYQKQMVDKGMHRQASPVGLGIWLMPNYLRPDGKWKNKKLREALEYAIDKAAITKALGYGYNIPMDLMIPPGIEGYDASLKRSYDPARARRLISEAGYKAPVTVKMLADAAGRITASALKGYLDAVGFLCEIDVADSARYENSIHASGWEDLCFAGSSVDPIYLVSITDWFSPQARMPSWGPPQTFSELWSQAITKVDIRDQQALTSKMVRYIHEEALICPLFMLPIAGVMQPYVHTNYLLQGPQRWNIGEDWMDRH
jgi:ABC-type transport system substrate-binding protein